MIKISVLMPIYNAQQYLEAALDSILIQTFTDFELLALNDGSTDNSLEILEAYEAFDSRIRVINKPNTGLIDTLNYGISLAKASVIARMDADDISMNERFRLQYDLIQKGFDIVGGHYSILGKFKKTILVPIDPGLISLKLMFGPPFCHGSVMMRKVVFSKCKYDNSEYDKCEDYYLWIRASMEGFRFGNVDEVLFEYRETPGSLSRVNYRLMMEQTKNLGIRYTESRRQYLIDCLNKQYSSTTRESSLLRYMSAIRLSLSAKTIPGTYCYLTNLKYLPEAVFRLILKRY